jgi:hypothetical protein
MLVIDRDPGTLSALSQEVLFSAWAQLAPEFSDVNSVALCSRMFMEAQSQLRTRLTGRSQPQADSASGTEVSKVMSQFMQESTRVFETLGRLKKRHRQVVRDQDSDDEGQNFDLSKALDKTHYPYMPSNWFVSTKMLTSLDKLHRSACEKKPHCRHPFLGNTGLENWIPEWVGSDLGVSAKLSLVKQWKNGFSRNPLQFLSTTWSFWASHAAVGIVSFEAVMLHIQLLLRMLIDQSNEYVVHYERRLIAEIEDRIRASEDFSLTDLLTRVDSEIRHDMDINYRRTVQPAGQRAERPKKSELGQQEQPRREVTMKAETKGAGKGRHKPICFQHDTSSGLSCERGANCRNEHLDTSKEDEKRRFQAAFTRVEEMKKSGPKGKGRASS